MNDSDHNPELEGILREIADDPDSKLLRVPTSGDLVRLTRAEPAGTWSPGLTVAERHLLAVHREELGYLLRERCVMGLFAMSNEQFVWHRIITATRRLEVPSEVSWRTRACTSLSYDPEDGRSKHARDALLRCIEGGTTPLTVARMAIAALRVARSPQARAYVAMELFRERRWSAAVDMYRSVLVRNPGELLGSYVLEGIGRALAYAGEPIGALVAFRDAAVLHEERPTPLANQLVTALYVGDDRLVLDASRRLDDLVDQGANLSWCRDVARSRAWHDEARAAAAVRRAADLKEKVGHASSHFLDAICA